MRLDHHVLGVVDPPLARPLLRIELARVDGDDRPGTVAGHVDDARIGDADPGRMQRSGRRTAIRADLLERRMGRRRHFVLHVHRLAECLFIPHQRIRLEIARLGSGSEVRGQVLDDLLDLILRHVVVGGLRYAHVHSGDAAVRVEHALHRAAPLRFAARPAAMPAGRAVAGEALLHHDVARRARRIQLIEIQQFDDGPIGGHSRRPVVRLCRCPGRSGTLRGHLLVLDRQVRRLRAGRRDGDSLGRPLELLFDNRHGVAASGKAGNLVAALRGEDRVGDPVDGVGRLDAQRP